MEVHSCVAELTEARELLKLQTDAGLGEEESLTTMFHAWQSKMRTLKATSIADKKAIIGAVSEGPWNMDQRVVLIRIVMGGQRRRHGGASWEAQSQIANVPELRKPSD